MCLFFGMGEVPRVVLSLVHFRREDASPCYGGQGVMGGHATDPVSSDGKACWGVEYVVSGWAGEKKRFLGSIISAELLLPVL